MSQETISIQVVDEKGELTGSVTINKAEAIERMAKIDWIKTVCVKNKVHTDKTAKEKLEEEWIKFKKKNYKNIYLKSAKAALEALLKGE